MTARLSLFFSCDKDKQIFHYFLLCIYTICSKSVLSLQQGCIDTRSLLKNCTTEFAVKFERNNLRFYDMHLLTQSLVYHKSLVWQG